MNQLDAETAKSFLQDMIALLKEAALKAKLCEDENQDRKFAAGYNLAYFEVIDLLQQQAVAFEIPLEHLNLHDIDPYKDLLLPDRNSKSQPL